MQSFGDTEDAYSAASIFPSLVELSMPQTYQEWWRDLTYEGRQTWDPDLLRPTDGPSLSYSSSSDMLHQGRDSMTSDPDPSRSLSHMSGSPNDWGQGQEFDMALHSDESVLPFPPSPVMLPDYQNSSGDIVPVVDSESHIRQDFEDHAPPAATLGKRKRRGYQPAELQKVNSVRNESACIRCQFLKEPCGEGSPCPRCLAIVATATVWRSPCFKGRITDVLLFRTRALSFPNGVRRKQNWASTQKFEISLYNVGYASNNPPAATRPAVSITCREFSPLPDDVLFKKWTRYSETVTLDLPAYAIPGNLLKRTSKTLSVCLQESWNLLVSELEFGHDEFLKPALREAIRCNHGSKMIHAALTICVITRLASKSFNICGKERLGIEIVEDPASPYYRRTPIPPFLDAQIDQIWMEKMGKSKKEMLSELKKKIMGRKEEDWYQIFLTLFLLIANLEFIYKVQNDQLNRYYRNVGQCLFSVPKATRGGTS